MAIFTAFPPINKSWSWTNQWQAERCHDKHLRSPTTCLCVRGGRGTGSTIKKGILKDLSLTYQMNIHNSISHKLPFILMFVFFFPGIHPPPKDVFIYGTCWSQGVGGGRGVTEVVIMLQEMDEDDPEWRWKTTIRRRDCNPVLCGGDISLLSSFAFFLPSCQPSILKLPQRRAQRGWTEKSLHFQQMI